MTNNRFMYVLRRYALLAAQRRKSYAEPVWELVASRQRTIEEELGDSEAGALQQRAVEQVALREYGKYDEKFGVNSTD